MVVIPNGEANELSEEERVVQQGKLWKKRWVKLEGDTLSYWKSSSVRYIVMSVSAPFDAMWRAFRVVSFRFFPGRTG
jgi:hypothetical protein